MSKKLMTIKAGNLLRSLYMKRTFCTFLLVALFFLMNIGFSTAKPITKPFFDERTATYPGSGKVEIASFKKTKIRSYTSKLKKGTIVYVVELKVTNTSKHSQNVKSIMQNSDISFKQKSGSEYQNVLSPVSIEQIVSGINVKNYIKLIDIENAYDSNVLPGKTKTLILPNLIQLNNSRQPLVIQMVNSKDSALSFSKRDSVTIPISTMKKENVNFKKILTK